MNASLSPRAGDIQTACLIGYTNRLSVRAGESIEVKVSSSFTQDYAADLVRIFSADPNPKGPGLDLRPVASPFEGAYPSVSKQIQLGSYGVIPLQGADLRENTFSIRFQPRLLRSSPQTLFSFADLEGISVSIAITDTQLVCRTPAQVSFKELSLRIGQWYELRIAVHGHALDVVGYNVADGLQIVGHQVFGYNQKSANEKVVLAATPRDADCSMFEFFFNGRLEAPTLLRGSQLPQRLDGTQPMPDAMLACWNFGLEMSTPTIRDTGPLRLDGQLFNLPTRAVRGSHWSGTEMCWRHAPDEYAAVHFHETDLYDAKWDTDFTFDTAPDLPSGVYGIRLRCGGAEDIIPFFVRPSKQSCRARIAILFSTFTYVAYANHPRSNFGAEYVKRRDEWKSYPYHPAEYPQYGRSLYDLHADGTGIMFSSILRPQLNMRPGYFAYVDHYGSGLRHFPADMHLISWCDAKGISVDIVTDHDLQDEGTAALAGYSLVLTVTHPEYHTKRTLDAIESYISSGGGFGYLGGNGFYWRIATNELFPGAIEIRRAEAGARGWECEPGEYFHAFDGQNGGLWLKNDRPPQRIFGIGMSAHGDFLGTHFVRTPASYDERFARFFEGIQSKEFGGFGYSGGGAAGFEVDVVDASLGTPPETVVLATTEGIPGEYFCAPEKAFWPEIHTAEWQSAQVRADLCIVPKQLGNFVFSTGSILFCGSLPFNEYDNDISRLLENVVRESLARYDELERRLIELEPCLSG
ncbi:MULTISPECIES: N,N-dimethylformamidase beta subunit family domain-containing protein [unclassified Mesorhizobium]|uniref:N,N-dimethylformamidase beta subunit family domain-containing protein n=1 Tax=unclassified Mesorhizobium TaxID=325217 RepID=UPI001926D2FE|nr:MULTISPECIES: N,N-dimethylformamidase beta subunit family domain-containing protein [unclassified Mesorhizobium]BCG82899.1 large subunit of N,N-dimethylformamidase [Mesorhizobium sp. 113-3-3]BCG90776.1 large subunit of N,N-dimethylformamidase [Mesorhizobium sp. 113-3-9]